MAPRTLLPCDAERFGVEIYTDMANGLAGADIVMMLRLQKERMIFGNARGREALQYFDSPTRRASDDKVGIRRPSIATMRP